MQQIIFARQAFLSLFFAREFFLHFFLPSTQKVRPPLPPYLALTSGNNIDKLECPCRLTFLSFLWSMQKVGRRWRMFSSGSNYPSMSTSISTVFRRLCRKDVERSVSAVRRCSSEQILSHYPNMFKKLINLCQSHKYGRKISLSSLTRSEEISRIHDPMKRKHKTCFDQSWVLC